MEPATPSPFLTISFTALTLVVCSLLVYGAWRSNREGSRLAPRLFTLGLGLWLFATTAIANAGLLSDFSKQPPRMFLVVFAGIALTLTVALGALGRRAIETLPLWAIVGLHGFRFPLELLMHHAYEEGVMPIQMSYSGRNFDIVSGVTALVVAFLLYRNRLPVWGIHLWNAIGFGLLLNIVTIAILSFPTPFRLFHNAPANTWVTHAPFVWLPAVLVMTALLGHVLVLRAALRLHRRPKAAMNPQKLQGNA
jgi:hypothetical protein